MFVLIYIILCLLLIIIIINNLKTICNFHENVWP
jgi:hypothetical protein